MKTQSKCTKLLSLLLTAIMVIALLPAAAFAATVDNSYAPGTYVGTAQGFKGDVNVTITLTEKDGNVVISDIQATGEKETPNYWQAAVAVLDTIKTKNGTDGVDAVSSATRSSTGIINAANNALEKANPTPTGSGTASDPYLIMNAVQLQKFANTVDEGETYEGKYVVLGADIDLSSVENWNPIGLENGNTNIFRGTFDGKGYSISGLKVNKEVTGEANYGFFSILGNQAIVKNLNIKNIDIDLTDTTDIARVGAIAGDTEKTAGTGHTGLAAVIDSCSVTGTIDVTTTAGKMSFAGGITGRLFNGGIVTNCWTDVNVTSKQPTDDKSAYAGGIAGTTGNYVVIANCAAFGSSTASAPKNGNYGGMTGGITSMLAGKQYNVYATGDMTVENAGSPHTWIGVLDGQVTSSGMTKDSNGDYTIYPEQGTFRLGSYYASDAKLTKVIYSVNSDTPTTEIVDTVDRGYPGASTSIKSVDKAMQSVAMTKADMATADFAEKLNSNIKEINKVLTNYGISGIALREWQLDDGRVLPTGSVWVSDEVDASIFASGDGSEENPFIISTADQLRAFASSMNDKIDYTGKYIKLGDDIDVSGKEWTPIGGSDYLFNGTFDGAGHSISGMSLGSADNAAKLDSENIYIGLFGVLGPTSVVKDVKITDIALYTSYKASAFVGGIAGVMQGSTASGNYTGAVIDNCSVAGVISHTSEKGNQFVGGLVGMQYKGAIINSSSAINASGVVKAGDLAEVGGLVGLNNRGLVANCWADCTIYGSGNRENGNEGMAVVSGLIACNAGELANCFVAGNISTEEHSTYAGMVSGWITGIGKSYNCWYELGSTMTLKVGDKNPQVVNPVESIGTKVASGVNDEGDAYTGGLADKMTGANGTSANTAAALNSSFSAFPVNITAYGLNNNSLRAWIFDSSLKLGDEYGSVTYVQPECEKVVKPEAKLNDGTWYGRDDNKQSVVSIDVKDGEIIKTAVITGDNSGEAYDAAIEKAKYKATYGDFSTYFAADVSKFGGGSGTAEDPYIIANESQLRYLSSSINSDVNWKGVYFKQTANITLSDEQWQPIGWALNAEVNGKQTQICAYPFRGNYDGGSYSISGLTIGSENTPADMTTAGMFGVTSGELTTNAAPDGSEQTVAIKNVNLKNIYINVETRYQTYVGGLVGSGQYGIYIDNCTVEGKIISQTSESFNRAGGLAASVMRGYVSNSGTDVEIHASTDTNNVYAGGFYSMDNRVTTYNCYSLGNVYGNSSNNNKVHIGGFVGQAGGIHYNCYAAGSEIVSEKTTSDVGAFSGRNAGINIDYYCYSNSEALVKQGDIVSSADNMAVGVMTTNAVSENCEGKTASELKSADFAKLLTQNASAEKVSAANTFVNETLASSTSGLSQANYYVANPLLGWKTGNRYVCFNNNAGIDSGSGSGGSSTGGSSTGGSSTGGSSTGGSSTGGSGAGTDSGNGDSSGDGAAAQHPTITAGEGGSVTLSKDGTSAAITPDKGYAVKSVLLNDKEQGAVTSLEGLKTGDKVVITFEAIADNTNRFVDVSETDWYYSVVNSAAEKGLMNGTSEDTFSPKSKTTRGMLMTILARKAGIDTTDSSPWYQKELDWAKENGISDGTNPEGYITRQQLATMLYRDAGSPEVTGNLNAFTDKNEVDDYAVKALIWAVDNGIVTGKGNGILDPASNATRAEMAAMIIRYSEK